MQTSRDFLLFVTQVQGAMPGKYLVEFDFISLQLHAHLFTNLYTLNFGNLLIISHGRTS